MTTRIANRQNPNCLTPGAHPFFVNFPPLPQSSEATKRLTHNVKSLLFTAIWNRAFRGVFQVVILIVSGCAMIHGSLFAQGIAEGRPMRYAEDVYVGNSPLYAVLFWNAVYKWDWALSVRADGHRPKPVCPGGGIDRQPNLASYCFARVSEGNESGAGPHLQFYPRSLLLPRIVSIFGSRLGANQCGAPSDLVSGNHLTQLPLSNASVISCRQKRSDSGSSQNGRKNIRRYLLPISLMFIGMCAPFVLIIRAHFGNLPFYTGPCVLLAYAGGVYGAFILAQRLLNRAQLRTQHFQKGLEGTNQIGHLDQLFRGIINGDETHKYHEGPKAGENFERLARAVLQAPRVANPKKQPKKPYAPQKDRQRQGLERYLSARPCLRRVERVSPLRVSSA